MRVAVAQFEPSVDKQSNIVRLERLVDEAVEAGAKLVVLPESSLLTSRPEPLDPAGYAERLDGPFVTAVRARAAAREVAVIVGTTELAEGEPGDPVFNTTVVVSPDGDLVAAYRKIHLYDAFGFRESDIITPGALSPCLVTVGGISVGIMTCYDLRFPELARLLAGAGADLLVLPAAWLCGPQKEHHWKTLLAARAIENTMYMAAAGQNGAYSVGCSMVVDPTGVVRAGCGTEDGFAVATLDFEHLALARRANPSLANRRFVISAP